MPMCLLLQARQASRWASLLLNQFNHKLVWLVQLQRRVHASFLVIHHCRRSDRLLSRTPLLSTLQVSSSISKWKILVDGTSSSIIATSAGSCHSQPALILLFRSARHRKFPLKGSEVSRFFSQQSINAGTRHWHQTQILTLWISW